MLHHIVGQIAGSVLAATVLHGIADKVEVVFLIYIKRWNCPMALGVFGLLFHIEHLVVLVQHDNTCALQFLDGRLVVADDARCAFCLGILHEVTEGEEQQVVGGYDKEVIVYLQFVHGKEEVADSTESGVVGLCAIIAAKMRGAKRIISTSRHADRLALAKEFGATDNVEERGDEAVKKIMELTNGSGADAVLECVGTEQSTDTAMKVGRPGAIIGRVGLPHTPKQDMTTPFYKNTIVAGGPASVTTYDKAVLLKAVLDGEINPGKVFTKSFSLDDIDAAYKGMDERQVIKSYVIVND